MTPTLVIVAGCTSVSPTARSDACWVNAYTETGYRGAMTTYTGPRYDASMLKDAASLAIGPGAQLKGFGQRRLDFHRSVSSFRLDRVG